MRARRPGLLSGCIGIAAIVTSFACGSESPVARPATAVDSADLTIVENGQSKWLDGEGWSLSPEPQLTIGVLDGATDYQFHDIAAAARQADGDIVVVDGGSRTIRIYGPDGAFRKTIGTAGEGPGEFRDPTQVLIEADDGIVVWDDAARRITRFDSAGGLVDVRSLGPGTLIDVASVPAESRSGIAEFAPSMLYPGPALLFSDGDLLVRLVDKNLAGAGTKGGGKPAPSPAGINRRRSGALRVSPEFAVDTVMFFGDVEEVQVEAPWGQQTMSPPLARNTYLAVQPNEPRTCIGEQEGPEIRCFDKDGPTTVIRWQPDPAPVRGNDPEIEAWRERILESYGLKISRDDVQRLIAEVPIPTERAEHSDLVLDREGNLWVRRGPNRDERSEAEDYIVFDRHGFLLGRVTIPAMRVLEIGTDYILGVSQDDLEVQYLQLFEIVKSGSPPS